MIRPFINIACLALWLVGCAPSTSFETAHQAVFAGEAAPEDHAVVYIEFVGEELTACTGTLVDPLRVVTAAHCLKAGTTVQVYFGAEPYLHGGSGDSTYLDEIPVVSSVAHPNYLPGLNEYDVAFLTLERIAPTAPIPIARELLTHVVDEPLRILGYGQFGSTDGNVGSRRQAAASPEQLGPYHLHYYGGAAGTCIGDSGGPHLASIGGVEHLVGVTSYGSGTCGSDDSTTAAVRVDSSMGFLIEELGEEELCAADGQCNVVCRTDMDCPPPEDEGGCSTGGAGTNHSLLVFALFLLAMQRRRPGGRDGGSHD